jgi:hypothetical protein
LPKKYFPNNLEYWREGGRSFFYHASEIAPNIGDGIVYGKGVISWKSVDDLDIT